MPDHHTPRHTETTAVLLDSLHRAMAANVPVSIEVVGTVIGVHIDQPTALVNHAGRLDGERIPIGEPKVYADVELADGEHERLRVEVGRIRAHGALT